MSTAKLVVFASVLLVATAARAAVQETFENTADITNNFTTTSAGAFTYSSVSTPPTIDSNSVEAASGDATATYSAASFTLAVGFKITTSVYVAQKPSTASSQVLMETGFGDQSSDVFNNGTSGHLSIYSRLVSNSTSTSYSLFSDNKNSTASAAAQTTVNGAITLAGSAGTPIWYLYSVTLTNLGSSQLETAGTIQFVGTDPTATPGASVGSYDTVFTNVGLAADAATGIYSGFRSNLQGGALRVDNFWVSDAVPAPEPSSVAVLGIAVTYLNLRRRKGQRVR